MKKSLITIALSVGFSLASVYATKAHADTFAVAPNKAGGTINLTDNTTPSCTRLGDYLVVFSTDTDHSVTRGCWRMIDDSAHIIWDSGNEKMIPLEMFTRTPYGERMRKKGTSL